MIEYAGSLDGRGLRIGVVVSRFNELVTDRLLAGALEALRASGVGERDVVVARVPGAFEIPFAARELATAAGVDAVVAVGCVIRGETLHFDIVAGESAAGLRTVALTTGVPVLNAILTTDTLEQALDRAGGKAGNLGRTAGQGAIEMARLRRAIQAASAEVRS
jgi:6,7-dimethyl-8-ribityllumazine synthase